MADTADGRLEIILTEPGTEGKRTFTAYTKRFIAPNIEPTTEYLEERAAAVRELTERYQKLDAELRALGDADVTDERRDLAKQARREAARSKLTTIYGMARHMIDPDARKGKDGLTGAQRAWIESDDDSDFWNEQDFPYLESRGDDFRKGLGILA